MTATPSRPTRGAPVRARRAPLRRLTRPTLTPPAAPADMHAEHAVRAVRAGRHLHAPHLRGQVLVALLALIYTATTRTGLRYAFDHLKSAAIVSAYTTLLFKLVSTGAHTANVLLWLALYAATFAYFRREQSSVTDEFAAQHIRARHDLLGDA